MGECGAVAKASTPSGARSLDVGWADLRDGRWDAAMVFFEKACAAEEMPEAFEGAELGGLVAGRVGSRVRGTGAGVRLVQAARGSDRRRPDGDLARAAGQLRPGRW